MEKKFFRVITREKAISLFENVSVMEKEPIKTKEASGRISASTITSSCDVPNFDRSTMDGYAVIARDSFSASETSPVSLKVAGKVKMGYKTKHSIEKGESFSIPTGGMLPRGADSVVMMEYTKKVDDCILIKRSVAPGENVVKKGSDIHEGELLFDIGKKIRPQDIGTFAACGITDIEVFKKPFVGIISTGDELVSPQDEPALGQIRGINSYTLYSMIEKYGGEPIDIGIVKDSMQKLKAAIEEALSQSNIVIISGGSSIGRRDITLDCISSFKDSKILANGLALKPGKPTILSTIKNKSVIGLPGHPVSCIVIFYLIVRPIIFGMLSYQAGFGDEISVKARMSTNVPSVSGREEYVRVRIRKNNQGVWAEPVYGGSAIISSLSRADGLIRISLEKEGLERGDEVEVIII